MKALQIIIICTLMSAAPVLMAAGWEYRIVRLYTNCEEEQLAALGRAGWEIGPPITKGDVQAFQSYIFKAPTGTVSRNQFDLSTWLDTAYVVESLIKAANRADRGTIAFGVVDGKPAIYLTEAQLKMYENGDRFLSALNQLTTLSDVDVYSLQASVTGERKKIGRLTKSAARQP